jgi:16S rRNA (guanine527-N7)-methyltransferase
LLREFAAQVEERNKQLNLVSRADTASLWTAHILHSLSILFVLKIPERAAVLDLGTGGGFPGVPLSIVRPDLTMVHIDSIAKKTNALREMLQAIGLSNQVLTGRAEEIVRSPEWQHRFDLVLARAVAPLADLVRWSRPLLKIRPLHDSPGHAQLLSIPALVAMKGGDLAEEISHARARSRPAHITVIDLDFPGCREAGLEEKKLIVVHP